MGPPSVVCLFPSVACYSLLLYYNQKARSVPSPHGRQNVLPVVREEEDQGMRFLTMHLFIVAYA